MPRYKQNREFMSREEVWIPKKVELSLNSTMVLIESRTMKLKGIMGSTLVMILIYCRTIQYFIMLELMDGLELLLTMMSKNGVVMGNGVTIHSKKSTSEYP